MGSCLWDSHIITLHEGRGLQETDPSSKASWARRCRKLVYSLWQKLQELARMESRAAGCFKVYTALAL